MDSSDFAPVAGEPMVLEPELRLILAPNPSPMTYLGTNTFLLGTDRLCVIDPGPDSDSHLAALMRAIGAAQVSHIVVTHNHLDHSPLAKRLAAVTGAPIYAFGTHLAGRSPIMAELARHGLAGGGEGIDEGFAPDICVQDGETLVGSDWSLTAIHTPGHIGNHLSLQWNDAIFTGDHVMDWASSLVSPPDGDLTDFMASCAKLQAIPARIYYPAHGAPIQTPKARVDWLIGHRHGREAQILTVLADVPATAKQITQIIYTDVPAGLFLAAERNVFAHLVDLAQKGKVTAQSTLSQTAIFQLSEEN
ncbi:MAG: MBL fold metallo-hydrolase [Yoonia sp.]|nr:MBL fold metallo-hydrolase [Yoonia sp.]MDG1864341.1 MBL fold metallo-hydrolase [Yoonia sp.]